MPHERTVPELIRTAKVLQSKAENATEKVEQYYVSLGLTLAELKEKKPGSITWPAFVKRHFTYSARRADELIQIGGGTTTIAKSRERARIGMKKSRAKSQRNVTPTRKRANGHKRNGPTPTAVAIPLNQQINDITRELDGFLDDWCASTEAWVSEHNDELTQERDGKDNLMHFLHVSADRLLRLAQALDGR